jgi:hypothetical protein
VVPWPLLLLGKPSTSNVRSNGGGEYIGNAFHQFVRSHGISWQQIVPYTPQQNGVTRQTNRVIMEMARCMLYSQSMKLSFWGEAVVFAAFIIDHTPTSVVFDMNPYERLRG